MQCLRLSNIHHSYWKKQKFQQSTNVRLADLRLRWGITRMTLKTTTAGVGWQSPLLCGRGVIGSRARFRLQSRKGWRFESSRPHQRSLSGLPYEINRHRERMDSSTKLPLALDVVYVNRSDMWLVICMRYINKTKVSGVLGVVALQI